MTTEAEARARLLDHYESKLAMLKEHVAALASELATKTDIVDRRAYMGQIKARESEIAKVEMDAARLRETIANG